jgi:hypothetical protein
VLVVAPEAKPQTKGRLYFPSPKGLGTGTAKTLPPEIEIDGLCLLPAFSHSNRCMAISQGAKRLL